jgi:hypothetical protein
MRVRALAAALLVLISVGVAVEPEVSEVVIEPNDPAWGPSDSFVPAWKEVELSTRLSNPDEVSGATELNSTQSLQISFNMYKGDLRNIISDTGFLRASSAQAVDEQNNAYTMEGRAPSLRIDTTPSPSFFADRPANLSLNFDMDPNVGYPTWFDQIDFTVEALFTRAIRTVKIPFEASDEWIEILPGYRVQVEEATVEDETYSYRLNTRSDSPESRPTSSLFRLGRDEDISNAMPKYMDMGLTFLNADGADVISISQGSSRSSSGSGSDTEYVMSGKGSCSACGGVTTIQFEFAVDPYIAQMFYQLNNIPVPTF